VLEVPTEVRLAANSKLLPYGLEHYSEPLSRRRSPCEVNYDRMIALFQHRLDVLGKLSCAVRRLQDLTEGLATNA
jgi:hypothetical protein